MFLIILVFAAVFYSLHKYYVITDDPHTEFVYIDNKQYNKNNISIKRGDIVRVQNHDTVRHTMKTDDPYIANSELLYPGDVYTIVFDNAGQYTFYSSLYSSMGLFYVTVE